MKRIRKIVALALATVMMMAMSVTAFAKDANDLEVVEAVASASTIKVTNISTRETSEVTIYRVADVDFANNTVSVNDWAKGVYSEDTTDYSGFTTELLNSVKEEDVTSATPVDGEVTFSSVKPGVYYVAIAGTLYTYNHMVVRAYGVTEDGKYSGIADAKLIAKGSKSSTEKTTEEAYKFVEAGTSVPFTIKTNIPYDATTFAVKDQPTNLTLGEATVKVAGAPEFTTDWTLVDAENGIYAIDLTGYVESYKNAEVVITYSAVVGNAIESAQDGYAYKNSAYTNINGEDMTPGTEVTGWTGTIVINKTKKNEEVLPGATFNILDSEGNAVKFVQSENGEYVYSTSESASADLVTNSDGKITATGLAEGTYTIKETAAPEGYTVDPTDYTATIVNTSVSEKNCVFTQLVVDPDLIRLPFTGGMGTTIFTVLGVAIMAAAAALYFATRRKATK